MGWGKTWEKQEQEAKAANEERIRKLEEKRAANTPVGRAKTAYANGDTFYQVEMEVSTLAGSHSAFGSSENSVQHAGSTAEILGQIEAIGWSLEHIGYVFVETGSTSTNRVLASGQGVVTKGHVAGIYLFIREVGGQPDQPFGAVQVNASEGNR